jgi:predicted transcriptional regulator
MLMNGSGLNFSRRKFDQILKLIKAHAVIHQYQREHLGDCIQATIADYKAVYELLPSMAEHTEEDLTPNGMALLRQINDNHLTAFTREDVMQSLNWSYSRAYRTLRELSRMELIKADQEKNGVKRLYRVNELWKLGSLTENVLNPDEVSQAIRIAFSRIEQKQTA